MRMLSSFLWFRPAVGNYMLPKRRFWKAEPTFQSACSKHFSTFCSPNLVLTPFKSASKTRSETLVRPPKIFVWGALTGPIFSTISILNISTKPLTTNPGWHFGRNVQNGDCRKKGTSCRRLISTDSFMVSKRRFGNVEIYVGNAFCKHFSALLAHIE